MGFTFRIRVNRCLHHTIDTDESSLIIQNEDNKSVVLSGTPENKPLRDSSKFMLIGSGYATDSEAYGEGVIHLNALLIAFAASRVGVDFGARTTTGIFTQHGLKMFGEANKTRLLNDTHGLTVYESEPVPRFISTNATHVSAVDSEAFCNDLRRAIQTKPQLTVNEQISFALFHASYFQPAVDSIFILRIMAIEALITQNNRSAEALELVNTLLDIANNSNLQDAELNSIKGSLNHLRYESIGQAGKRFVAQRLGDGKRYNGMAPSDFFKNCYNMRSQLVHGNIPQPTFSEVGTAAAHLELFVSDLLTQHVLPK